MIGKSIYLLGAADSFQGPVAVGNDFHSEAGRDGTPIGRTLLVLDTANLEELRRGAEWGVVAGAPTNPSLIAKEGPPLASRITIFGQFCPLER